MKNWSAGLLAHYAQATATLATCWKVVRTDAQVFGWTDHDQNLVIAGVTYRAAEGLQVSAASTEQETRPNTIDLTAFMDDITDQELESGLWDYSEITMFECNWASLPVAIGADTNILRYGNLGEVRRIAGRLEAELLGLGHRLERRIGRVYSPECPWRLGDSRCQVDLGPFTVTGTLTAVGALPRFSFSDSSRTEDSGYFNEGIVRFTTGDNAGYPDRVIRRWQGDQFTVRQPLPFPAQVGDQYTAIRGCDKSKATCIDVFDNYLNFGGQAELPGIDKVQENQIQKGTRPQPPPTPDGNPQNEIDQNISSE